MHFDGQGGGPCSWTRANPMPRVVAAQLRRQPEVAFAEPNYLYRIHDTPNDPGFESHQWNLRTIDMPRAWDINRGGNSNLIVAVVDSGITTTTETFTMKTWSGTAIQDFNVRFATNPDLFVGETRQPDRSRLLGGSGSRHRRARHARQRHDRPGHQQQHGRSGHRVQRQDHAGQSVPRASGICSSDVGQGHSGVAAARRRWMSRLMPSPPASSTLPTTARKSSISASAVRSRLKPFSKRSGTPSARGPSWPSQPAMRTRKGIPSNTPQPMGPALTAR